MRSGCIAGKESGANAPRQRVSCLAGWSETGIEWQIYELLPPEAVKDCAGAVSLVPDRAGAGRAQGGGRRYSFGGVRTFPLIGLIGYSIALVSGTQLLPLTIGFLVVAGFLLLSYWHKLCADATTAGVTTEMSGLATFLVGALVCYGHFWIATTLAVASLLLLDLKAALEKLATTIAPHEILTFAKFLFLTGVILPVLPNQEYGRFHINPFKTWLVVVAISAISYASYVLQKLTKGQGGIVLAALLGGAYSSTVTTVVLAKQGKRENHPHLFSGGILMASGVMYLRLAIAAGALQPATDGGALDAVSRAGVRGAGRWMAVDAARGQERGGGAAGL